MSGLASVFGRHWPRLTLGLILAIGGELLAWSFPPDREALDWLLILAGYVALAYALTDLAVRWRLRDLYGVAAFGGVAALLYALLINPQSTLLEIPRTLVTRALGAQGLILMGMLLLWLILLGVLPLRRLMLPVAAVMGLCWGTWVRYAPILTEIRAPMIDANTFALIGVAVAVAIAAVAYVGARLPATPPSVLTLDPYDAGFVAAVFIALAYRQIDLGTSDNVSRGIVVGLIGLCLAMQWFRKESTRTYFAAPVRVQPDWPLIVLSLIALLACAGAAFGTPIIGDDSFNQLTAVVLLFGAFGVSWLPGVAVILGLRAVLREVSATDM